MGPGHHWRQIQKVVELEGPSIYDLCIYCDDQHFVPGSGDSDSTTVCGEKMRGQPPGGATLAPTVAGNLTQASVSRLL